MSAYETGFIHYTWTTSIYQQDKAVSLRNQGPNISPQTENWEQTDSLQILPDLVSQTPITKISRALGRIGQFHKSIANPRLPLLRKENAPFDQTTSRRENIFEYISESKGPPNQNKRDGHIERIVDEG